MSSDLRFDDLWAAPGEQAVTRLSTRPLADAASGGTLDVQPELREVERDAAIGPEIARRGSNALRVRLLVGDAAGVAAAWLLLGMVGMPATTDHRQWAAALVATAVTLAALQLFGLYRSRLCAQPFQELGRIVVAVAFGAVAFELVRGGGKPRYVLDLVIVAACVSCLITLRWMFGQWLRTQRARGRYLRGVVMVGSNEDAASVWTLLDSEPELGYEVRGVIGDLSGRREGAHLPNSDQIDRLGEIARQAGASGVLLVANALTAEEARKVIELAAANRLHVQVWPGFWGLGSRRVRRFPMSGETFLYVEPGGRSMWQVAVKRVVDLVGAVIGLMIAAPVLLLSWVAVRLEDGGPVLFRQVRIGLDDRPFVVYKLRTMTSDAEAVVDLSLINERTDGPLFKAVHDPRVTKVGSLLRALSIDELPQLFNVLAGTMSLVGPRPALPQEVAQFDPELRRRHAVKPGITGLWQLEARDNPSFHAYRRLDLLYVDNWSIGLDLFILAATLPMVITRALRIGRRDRTPREVPSEGR